jgi:AcrR family transcriptional regulator
MNDMSDTRGRILDAAERLFAQQGYDRTSLRAITGSAGVNLAAVNYHFGSKEALLEAVIERRLVPLNEVRMERLRAVLERAREGDGRPAVGDVLTAFMEPTLRFKESGEGARDFITLVASAVSVPAGGPVRSIFMRMVEPLFRNLFGALREALPGVPEDVLMWRVHFAMGAMLRTMQMFCDEHHPEKGMCPEKTDAETVLGVLIPFVTAGMEAP